MNVEEIVPFNLFTELMQSVTKEKPEKHSTFSPDLCDNGPRSTGAVIPVQRAIIYSLFPELTNKLNLGIYVCYIFVLFYLVHCNAFHYLLEVDWCMNEYVAEFLLHMFCYNKTSNSTACNLHGLEYLHDNSIRVLFYK